MAGDASRRWILSDENAVTYQVLSIYLDHNALTVRSRILSKLVRYLQAACHTSIERTTGFV